MFIERAQRDRTFNGFRMQKGTFFGVDALGAFVARPVLMRGNVRFMRMMRLDARRGWVEEWEANETTIAVRRMMVAENPRFSFRFELDTRDAKRSMQAQVNNPSRAIVI